MLVDDDESALLILLCSLDDYVEGGQNLQYKHLEMAIEKKINLLYDFVKDDAVPVGNVLIRVTQTQPIIRP